MNRSQIRQSYISRRDALDAQISSLKRRSIGFLFGQIASFAVFLAFLVLYTVFDWGCIPILLSVCSLAVYAAVRHMDAVNSRRTEHLESLRKVADGEIRYHSGDFSGFDDGSRYADAGHPFAHDLDIFGRDSLYNRIDRTVTTGGADVLAGWLSEQHSYSGSDSIEAIGARRQAIDALAAMPAWREEFVASGCNGKTDTRLLLAAMQAVRSMNMSDAMSSAFALVVACGSWLCFVVLILLSVFTSLPSTVPVLWGVFQFFAVLMSCSGPLRAIGRAAGKMHGQMSDYVALLRHVSCLDVNRCEASCRTMPAAQPELIGRLRYQLSGALGSFHEIEQIVRGVDRRANILGLIVFDTFLLSDFFLVRRFLRWQRTWLSSIEPWAEAVSRIDALVSMATFRYNEPEAVAAQLADTDDVVYEARGLYHPFLGASAVRNDFMVKDGNYYIITGANMAGKSTFLRSIGVNYILAMNGMPVFADSLRVSVFPLFTSMRTTDDLTRGISYFNAELLRLRQLIGESVRQRNMLIILDEILKGTNSADKLNGSRLFLEYISSRRVSGVIATHDLELSRMSETHPGRFHNYCFEIELGTDVTYTYKISHGVARNQNATFLLRRMLGDAGECGEV